MIDEKVSALPGIGAKREEYLADSGIYTISDLLFSAPTDHEDRTSPTSISLLSPGTTAYTEGIVTRVMKSRFSRGRRSLLKLRVEDRTGSMEVLFFNAAYQERNLDQGTVYSFYGKVTENRGIIQMIHPSFGAADGSEKGLFPVYRTVSGISSREMRKIMRNAVKYADEAKDVLPRELRTKKNLLCIGDAIRLIHFPKDRKELERAKTRFIYDRMFLMQIGVSLIRMTRMKGIAFPKNDTFKEFADLLPYKLTDAQIRAIREIENDMESSSRMNRLLQGDVGSGKTAVACAAMYKACKAGYQSAFMAPTELLASQQFESFRDILGRSGARVGLLTGHMSASEHADACEDLRSGELDIIVGTHALISEGVEFHDLGLVVTDEQHRFGVEQRSLLGAKGKSPDILVMTATPIPRSLAVIMYGEQDISVLDETPPGRLPILTKAVSENSRDIVYDFVKGRIENGERGYVTAPLVEDSDEIEAHSATGIYNDLKKRYPDVSVALLHGRMKDDEKATIMEGFKSGEYSILVSTIVIEVGIDVPEATFMIIENAERFGLAQLHQLRGRVGRGKDQSYCILITDGKGEAAIRRAKTMVSCSDGFAIAENDLKLRGPGEFFGTRQHGISDAVISEMTGHPEILEQVRPAAEKTVTEDPELEHQEHLEIRKRMRSIFGENINISI